MNKSNLSLAVLLGLMATSANATDKIDSSNTFQHEANVTFGSHTDDLDNGLWSIDYRYYFKPVDVEKGPYALSGFLAQTSNIGAQYAQVSTFDDSVSYSIDGRYVLESNWFVGANYSKVDLDSEDSLIITLADDMSEYGFSFGYYFNDTSEVLFAYQTSSSSGGYSYESPYYIYNSSSEYDSKIYSVQAHSFIPLESFTGIDLQANWSYIDSDSQDVNTTIDGSESRTYQNNYQVDTNIVAVAADWYITKSWSVGANYLWSQYDMESKYTAPDAINTYNYDDSNSSYSLSTAYWWQISQSFAAKFSAAKQFGLDGDNGPDGLMVGATINGRF